LKDERKAANNGLFPICVGWHAPRNTSVKEAPGRGALNEDEAMKKHRATDFKVLGGVQDQEANRQLVWTVGWTFTFLIMSIFFLQGA
jgi:hypothetical protein